MSARQVQPFEAKGNELAALDAAATRFLGFYGEEARFNPKELAAVRAAARAFHQALHRLITDPLAAATLRRLALRMQEQASFANPQTHYVQELRDAWLTALQVDQACDKDVGAGRKSSERTNAWICMAAEAWEDAGGTASARHRFGSALGAYHRKGLPTVGGIEAIDSALAAFKAQRNRASD